MYPCSHVYFARKGEGMLPESPDTELRDVAIGFCPDMDEVFSRWPTLRCLYEECDQILHRDCDDLAARASQVHPAYTALHGMQVHVEQDAVVHSFIDENSHAFREELSDVLGREVTEMQAHEGMELYIESKVLEREPGLARELSQSLRGIKPYLRDLSMVLASHYRQSGYPVKPRSFYNAMKVGVAIGHFSLKGQKQRRFLSKASAHRRCQHHAASFSPDSLSGRMYGWFIDRISASCLSYYDSSLSGILPSPYDERVDLSYVMRQHKTEGVHRLDALMQDLEDSSWCG